MIPKGLRGLKIKGIHAQGRTRISLYSTKKVCIDAIISHSQVNHITLG